MLIIFEYLVKSKLWQILHGKILTDIARKIHVNFGYKSLYFNKEAKYRKSARPNCEHGHVVGLPRVVRPKTWTSETFFGTRDIEKRLF